MEHKYYNSQVTIYHVVDDGSFFHVYRLKNLRDIVSANRAWDYLKKFDDKQSCNNFLMTKTSSKNIEDLQRHQMTEQDVEWRIQGYIDTNSK